jgi:aerobic carbon-monoxide dehydrogenase large subunit
MTHPQSTGSPFGASIKRREDPRLITGQGKFVDDIVLPGTTHAAFVRSPHAHAVIRSIDTTRAEALKGVRAIFTGADLVAAGVNPIPVGWLLPDIKIPSHMPLAVEHVCHVGEAVAVVIADSPYVARDAAELVSIDYEPLPAVADTATALDNPTQIFDVAPGNRAFHWAIGDTAATDEAFKAATHVVRQRLVNNRLSAVAIEPRACLASYNRGTEDLTLWVTSQNPHVHRLIMGAFVLGLPEHKFRVIAPDVGGGFGSKIFIYPEECVIAWASKKTGRPVKWTATRSESFLTDAQGRDHVTDAELALGPDGQILGLRVKTIANMGAYLSLFAPCVPTYLYGTLLSGPYAIPTIDCQVDAVFTNTVPVDAYRGAGRPEACYVLERLMDLAANQIGVDPAVLRRKNFVASDKFPYQTPVALTYDSGNYAPALDLALKKIGYPALRAEQLRARQEGRFIGIGLSTYIEACSLAPSAVVGSLGAQAGLYESANVRVHPTGKVTVYTGSHSHGQGHETTFAQIVAGELGIPMEDVDIIHGDTGQVQFGMGTYGSRSGAVGGTAIYMSLQKIKEKAKKIAAHLLEASADDIELDGGKFFVRGSPDRSKAFPEITLAAYLAHNYPAGLEPGLEASSFYDPSNFTFPFGAHVAVVEVAPDTGAVKVLRYVAVDDVGNVINPMIVDGMVHGGIAQGMAQALWEHARYDDAGQPLTASLMEYAIPKADQVVNYETDRTVTPSPVNPLGVKGAGETGTIASPAAVANAVLDALTPFGVTHIDMPLTPDKLWAAMQRVSGRA